MYPLPLHVYQNKKALKGSIYLYVICVLFLLWAIKKDLSRMYDAQIRNDINMFILCLIFLAILIIRACRKLANKEPLLTLLPEGIRFNDKVFKDIGVVRWADIVSCQEVDMGYYMMYGNAANPYLIIDVKDRTQYANRIENAGQRRRFLKKCKKYSSLLWVKKGTLDTDLVQLKRTVFQMKDKMQQEHARPY